MSEPFNAESIEQRVINLERALSTALLNAGRLARVVDEQSARIESLEGANVKRDSESEPDAEPPYRMTEPENVGAVVMGAWFDALFTRFDRELNPWVSLRTGCVYEWVDIPDPQPYQNCTLTADDPEPPVDSSVRSPEGVVSVRWPSGWSDIGLPRGQRFGWDEVTETPVTLLYRGEA